MGLALAGCFNREQIPYLGRWSGGFNVDHTTGKIELKDPHRYSMHGLLELYRSDSRCTLHIEGEQETVEAKGNWTIKGHEIQIQFSHLTIDDAGGPDERDPNRAFLPAADYQTTLSHDLGLRASADKKHLTSPLESIGPLLGSFTFDKDVQAH